MNVRIREAPASKTALGAPRRSCCRDGRADKSFVAPEPVHALPWKTRCQARLGQKLIQTLRCRAAGATDRETVFALYCQRAEPLRCPLCERLGIGKDPCSSRSLGRIRSRFFRFNMTAKLLAHGRQNLVRETCLLARPEACVERSGQHVGRNGFLDRRHDGPAAFAEILDEPGIALQIRVFGQVPWP